MNLDAEHVSLLGCAVPWAAAAWRLRKSARVTAAAIIVGSLAGIAAVLMDATDTTTTAGTRASAAIGALFGCTLGAGFVVITTTPRSRRRGVTSSTAAIGVTAVAIICALIFIDSRARGGLVLAAILLLTASTVAHSRYAGATPYDQRSARWIGLSALVLLSAVPILVGARALGFDGHWRWLAIATVGVVGCGFLTSTIPAMHASVDAALRVGAAVAASGTLLGATAVGVAIVRERSFDGSERRIVLLAIATATVASAFAPTLLRAIHGTVRRLGLGDRPSPSEAVARFSSRLTRAVPLLELLTQMCDAVRSSMQLQSVEVWRLTGETLSVITAAPASSTARAEIAFDVRAVAALLNTRVSGGSWADVWLPELVRGRASADVRVAPLLNGGEILGVILCERSAAGDAFTSGFDEDLADLARNVALALRNLRLDAALQASQVELEARNAQLTESRARLVAAGDEQRRRIERDLHDGAQQQLVSVALKLRLARDVLAADANEASALLAELGVDIELAIGELRNLAHGIFPPVLASGGLRPALAAAATRSPIPVSVDVAGDVARYDADLEVAVYFCCVEALQNAAKHATSATAIEVRLWCDLGELCFEVSDDGRGFDPTAMRSGHGFTNMRDRLGARAGRLEIASAIGAGTRVLGRAPIAARRP